MQNILQNIRLHFNRNIYISKLFWKEWIGHEVGQNDHNMYYINVDKDKHIKRYVGQNVNRKNENNSGNGKIDNAMSTHRLPEKIWIFI